MKDILIGECKFKNTPFDYGEYLDTVGKFSSDENNINKYYALFSASGFDEIVYAEVKTNADLMLFDLHDIVSGTGTRNI